MQYSLPSAASHELSGSKDACSPQTHANQCEERSNAATLRNISIEAYESAKYAEEKINALQKKKSKFDEDMPDIYLVKSEKLIIYDNFNHTMQAIYNANPQQTSYEDALIKIDEIQVNLMFLMI